MKFASFDEFTWVGAYCLLFSVCNYFSAVMGVIWWFLAPACAARTTKRDRVHIIPSQQVVKGKETTFLIINPFQRRHVIVFSFFFNGRSRAYLSTLIQTWSINIWPATVSPHQKHLSSFADFNFLETILDVRNWPIVNRKRSSCKPSRIVPVWKERPPSTASRRFRSH